MKQICMVALFQIVFMTMSCSNVSPGKDREGQAVRLNEEETPALVNFTSFQNADKTWGFTIFVNNVPFRNYNTIPYKSAQSGFHSKKEAESVAGLFVNMIKKGIQSPKLTKNMIDSLGLQLDKMEQPPS